MKRRGELRLIEQSIRAGWDVPQKARQRAVELIEEILSDPNASDRELHRATLCALLMDEADLDAQLRGEA